MKLVIFVSLSLLIVCSLGQSYSTAPFDKLNISKNDITISGISSGAFMADQLQIIYSSIVKGSGSMAGGPYYCAQGQMTNAMMSCMYATMQINVQQLVTQAQTYAQSGLIDPTSNLKSASVWVQSGTLDTTVKQTVSQSLQSFYQSIGVGNIQTNFNIPCAHNWITDVYGNACNVSQEPYIAKCSENAIQEMLTQIYGGSRKINSPVTQISSNLFQFAQSTYAPSGFTSLSDTGYAYIPTNCQNGQQCSIHFAFHGCQQDYAAVGNAFITESNLNEYAESNNIVIIYPQVSTSNDMTHSNPEGCWDWWGYTSSDYCNNKGVQPTFFRNMVKQIVKI